MTDEHHIVLHLFYCFKVVKANPMSKDELRYSLRPPDDFRKIIVI
jgi:hypothetical protein